jgi:myo-inositol-1(or 4)-monophosphatase
MALHPIVNIAVAATKRAEKIIMGACDKLDRLEIVSKGENDFATEVDKAAEVAIIDTIRHAYPSHGIIAEETGTHSGSDTVWIIDPIDGTRNFMHGFPHFCISIAVQVKGRLEHGVIYDPLRNELFTASRGEGAQLDGRRLRVAARQNLSEALIGTGFPFRNKKLLTTYLKTFEAIFTQCAGVRRTGSAALDLAYVASGRLDGFWEFGLNSWDIAAGVVLIQEAGGLVSDFAGSENFLDSGNIVAGNPRIFKQILQTLASSLPRT